jgi:hypothetical protein
MWYCGWEKWWGVWKASVCCWVGGGGDGYVVGIRKCVKKCFYSCNNIIKYSVLKNVLVVKIMYCLNVQCSSNI